MSRMAKITLAVSVAITSGIVGYVHYTQALDRQNLKEGVYVDLARQERKRQNLRQLTLQADLTKMLRQQQDEEDERRAGLENQETEKS